MRLFSLEIVLIAALGAYFWYAYHDKSQTAAATAAAAGAPATYAEWARDRALDCERTGGGQWHAGLGLPLKEFCAALAHADMRQRLCQDRPALC
ncbi:MAG: hypothetical protein AB7O45_10755 [Alphaproteobacteria bacterium]